MILFAVQAKKLWGNLLLVLLLVCMGVMITIHFMGGSAHVCVPKIQSVKYCPATTDEQRIKILNQLGWQVGTKAIEEVPITIPRVFDQVYQNYNALQKEVGMDLNAYKGKKVIRYTYLITNFPNFSGEVRANLLVSDGCVIAGDLMSPRIDGFMLPLQKNK